MINYPKLEQMRQKAGYQQNCAKAKVCQVPAGLDMSIDITESYLDDLGIISESATPVVWNEFRRLVRKAINAGAAKTSDDQIKSEVKSGISQMVEFAQHAGKPDDADVKKAMDIIAEELGMDRLVIESVSLDESKIIWVNETASLAYLWASIKISYAAGIEAMGLGWQYFVGKIGATSNPIFATYPAIVAMCIGVTSILLMHAGFNFIENAVSWVKQKLKYKTIEIFRLRLPRTMKKSYAAKVLPGEEYRFSKDVPSFDVWNMSSPEVTIKKGTPFEFKEFVAPRGIDVHFLLIKVLLGSFRDYSRIVPAEYLDLVESLEGTPIGEM